MINLIEGSKIMFINTSRLLYSLLISLLLLSCTNSIKTEEYRELRLKKLAQSRPVIHNNDGCDTYLYPANREFSLFNFLDYRSAGLKGSDVSTISYCSITSSFGQFTHQTKVGEFLTLTHQRPGRRNVVPEFVKLGTDPLEVTNKFAHENGFEFFWSNRINDTHDYGHRPDNPYERWSKLKTKHPEFLFGTPGERLPHGRWSSVDFSHKEIRDLCVQYYTEVCENYDVDGIELDFFRHLYLFGNVARGEYATAEQLEMFTSMVAQIREMTEKVGMKKGKPILVLVRVPDCLDYCRGVGIDLETWMAKGLIDIVVGSGYFRLNPWDHMVSATRKYDVKFYAGLSEPRIRDEHPYLQRLQNAVYRARSAAAWQAGVDGLYIFNEYNTRSQYLREIGEAEKLSEKNNLYFVTYRNANPESYLKNGKQHLNIPVLSPQNPMVIESDPLEFSVEIGDESKPSEVFVILYANGVKEGELKIVINSTQGTFNKITEDGLVIFNITGNVISPGENKLIVQGSPGISADRKLLDAAILFYRDKTDSELNQLTELFY